MPRRSAGITRRPFFTLIAFALSIAVPLPAPARVLLHQDEAAEPCQDNEAEPCQDRLDESDQDERPTVTERVEVIGLTPLDGVGIARDRLPANIQVLTRNDLDDAGSFSLNETLNRRLASITIADTQNNPMQPELSYRGFTVSSLLGVAQGLAIFQNGVRINEAFGDTVQFDLVPEFAIQEVQLLPGSNPAFGLSALGGAIVLQMRDGFRFDDAEIQLQGGSFGRLNAAVQYGVSGRTWGFYAGGKGFTENGWRRESGSDLVQVYSALSLRKEILDAGASLMFASTDLNGNGVAPTELLQADRRAVFTFPDNTSNGLYFLTLNADYAASEASSIQANAYFRRLQRDTINGDATEIQGCLDNEMLLCNDNGEGEPVTDLDEAIVHSASVGTEPFGLYNRSATRTNGFGVSLQTTLDTELRGQGVVVAFGGNIDVADTEFELESEIGTLSDDRRVLGSGITIGGQEYRTAIMANNLAAGVYAVGTMMLSDRLDLTASARFNAVHLEIEDRHGELLNGSHDFRRLNPSVGLSYRPLDDRLSLYAGYSESNRTPTPAEVSCADPELPCRFPNAFVADPPLRQVVARTLEAGARGHLRIGAGSGRLHWSLAGFRASNADDIHFVSSGPVTGSGYFVNTGHTRRLGAELSLVSDMAGWSWYLNYAVVAATFQDPLTIRSAHNPAADTEGEIHVEPGDRIPGIPLHSAKLGLTRQVAERWRFGVEANVSSSRFLRGDESNERRPVDGYQVMGARVDYRISEQLSAFARGHNVLDTRHHTFGTFGDSEEVELQELRGGAAGPRFLGPGAPRAVWVGLTLRY